MDHLNDQQEGMVKKIIVLTQERSIKYKPYDEMYVLKWKMFRK